ncbi:MAG: 30S ribosomal protein S12 methylthiotransferase RimO [Candidatus Bipolaricaulota bacterium]|nr:30S ribosomal protein S12 methylthiotransferase RimO [Candidatus Bipolaricaulota bacterium]
MAKKSESSRAPRVHLASLGCAKNLVDSERLLGRLAAAGAIVGAPVDEADVAIVNTCGFIAPAREESLDVIHEYVAWRREASGRRLFVMGCLVARSSEELRALAPEVDGFFGIDDHAALVRAVGLAETDPEDEGRLLLTPHHTAYLRISDGCDNRCSYCTIPSIRGPFRSRPMDEILREASDLAAFGVREVNVIGQDTSLYGVDLSPRVGIHDLLGRLSAIQGLRWIRLLYVHPAHVSDELIDAYTSLPNLVPYVDLPLQHLSDTILEGMNRHVTQADCLRLIKRWRERVPGVSLRTTFIVGFPGETEAQFAELLDFVRDLSFDHVGAFAYSPEEGTPAAALPNRVPSGVVEDRLRRLMELQQEIVRRANKARIGTEVEVLVDGPAAERGVWISRTATQAPDVDAVTRLRGKRLAAGEFVRARIVGFEGYDLDAVAIP